MRNNCIVSKSVVVAARKRLLTMHFESGVGHIGGNLSALDALLVVWHEFIAGQSRFILSKGHGAGALYVALWSVGRLTDLDLKTFHQDNTLLAGHPPATGVTDIPFATGSLGHGLSLAAGTALAMQLRGQPDRVFCMTSDGEWQEGSTWEALIFACHHKLTNLTVLVDHNGLQGFGTTAAVASMSPLHEKLLGFDVQVTCVNGHDLSGIRDALCVSPPKLHIIVLETIKGNGVRFMENKLEWHYLPLSLEQFHAAMEDIERI